MRLVHFKYRIGAYSSTPSLLFFVFVSLRGHLPNRRGGGNSQSTSRKGRQAEQFSLFWFCFLALCPIVPASELSISELPLHDRKSRLGITLTLLFKHFYCCAR